MGEVDHADDPVNHGVSDGDQAVDHAERDAVDELLQGVGQSGSDSNVGRNATMRDAYGARIVTASERLGYLRADVSELKIRYPRPGRAHLCQRAEVINVAGAKLRFLTHFPRVRWTRYFFENSYAAWRHPRPSG